ncbi:MAG: phosphoribosylformylglycinamidine synthase subunit PurQ [Thermodesulfobacteriota bacterium]|nr:phosphoribosylformylglycinamidine synthase subunit PurQ [Thermodesulfobacteriota bacterium]
MKEIKALIIAGYGTNCEKETAFACSKAGASTHIAHINEILNAKVSMMDYGFICLPGGFLDGDDLGSARIESIRLKFARIQGKANTLLDEILLFVSRGGLILGICNGFQALVKSGILPGMVPGKRVLSLSFNDSGIFEDRWVRLAINPKSPCVFTRGMDSLFVPVRHGEGKLICESNETIEGIKNSKLDVLYYADKNKQPTMEYPLNPNGSTNAIAGVCDPSGHIFGLMPHPEAFTHFTNHPSWTRMKDIPDRGEGMAIFDNAVGYLRENT